MKNIIFLISLILFVSAPLTAEANFRYSSHYDYGSGGHHRYYGYSKYRKYKNHHYYGHRHSPYYKKGGHYGYSYRYKKPYYYSSTYGSNVKYHHLYKDTEGYSFFHSPIYSRIYCDHPNYQKYHDGSVNHWVKRYCGDKYAHY